MSGRDAAEIFYDRDKFVRAGAAPEPVRATLFGKKGVQGLDGAAHELRKQMFMSLMTPARIEILIEIHAAWWRAYAYRWMS
jgi:fatty-acid peroxygenase